jgi:hypothetical protein
MDRKDTQSIGSRKAQLIADLAVARSGLRRDINQIRRAANVPAQIGMALKGNSGKVATAAGAVSVAAGALVSKFFKKEKEADLLVAEKKASTDLIYSVLNFVLSAGIDRYLKKDWQKSAAREVLALVRGRISTNSQPPVG